MAPLDRDKLIAELIAEGWLEQEFRLTDKSRELLAADPVEMDDYTYWCVHSRARYAYALAEGYSLTAAGIGGPWRREGERSHNMTAVSTTAPRKEQPMSELLRELMESHAKIASGRHVYLVWTDSVWRRLHGG